MCMCCTDNETKNSLFEKCLSNCIYIYIYIYMYIYIYIYSSSRLHHLYIEDEKVLRDAEFLSNFSHADHNQKLRPKCDILR